MFYLAKLEKKTDQEEQTKDLELKDLYLKIN